MQSDANTGPFPVNPATSGVMPRIWSVGALCHAVADALEARFGALRVQGEIAGFVRAASGHCYFTLKDAQGQLRCVMFRRAAGLLGWEPREGDRIEALGRLDRAQLPPVDNEVHCPLLHQKFRTLEAFR